MTKQETQMQFGTLFGPPREFRMKVPHNYDHKTQLDSFLERILEDEEVFCLDGNMTGENFSRTSSALLPGKTYCVQLIPVLRVARTAECLAFLRNEGALLVGAQGLTLLCELNKSHFAKGRHIVSFDEEELLWRDEKGRTRVPTGSRDSSTTVLFDLTFFSAFWTHLHDLLCIKKM